MSIHPWCAHRFKRRKSHPKIHPRKKNPKWFGDAKFPMERAAFLRGSMNQELKLRVKLGENADSFRVTVLYWIAVLKSLKTRLLNRV
jgi:hypothetical protein